MKKKKKKNTAVADVFLAYSRNTKNTILCPSKNVQVLTEFDGNSNKSEELVN